MKYGKWLFRQEGLENCMIDLNKNAPFNIKELPLASGDDVEFCIDEHLRPSTLRHLGMTLEMDARIDAMDYAHVSPVSAGLLFLLRLYRKIRPTVIGNRCVYEPSCSRYSELSIRHFGPLVGVKLTMARLFRCKPGNGGIDLPPGIKNGYLGVKHEV